MRLRLIVFALLSFTGLYAFASRPNVIILISDDQGYGDFGAMGNTVIETPNIDAMAKRSVLWDNLRKPGLLPHPGQPDDRSLQPPNLLRGYLARAIHDAHRRSHHRRSSQ